VAFTTNTGQRLKTLAFISFKPLRLLHRFFPRATSSLSVIARSLPIAFLWQTPRDGIGLLLLFLICAYLFRS